MCLRKPTRRPAKKDRSAMPSTIRRGHPTVMLLMMLGCFVQLASSQQRPSLNQATTFTSPDGTFSVSHPKDFRFCKRVGTAPCVESYIPVCDDDAIICIVYSPPEFKNTNFAAATFQVRKITRMGDMTPNVCVTPYPRKDGNAVSDWPEFQVLAEHPIENIDGVQFLHGISGGAATSALAHHRSISCISQQNMFRVWPLTRPGHQ